MDGEHRNIFSLLEKKEVVFVSSLSFLITLSFFQTTFQGLTVQILPFDSSGAHNSDSDSCVIQGKKQTNKQKTATTCLSYNSYKELQKNNLKKDKPVFFFFKGRYRINHKVEATHSQQGDVY